jgi:hypothetical protein
MKKQYVGLVKDHSGSMTHLACAALKDYNSLIEAIKTASDKEDIDTIVSVVKCGVGFAGAVEAEIVNSSVSRLKPQRSYATDGSYTPLLDSVGEVIRLLEASPDAKDPNVTFLVMVVTDGQENHSTKWTGRSLGDYIVRLQDTDRWTFTFRVPYGGKRVLAQLGIPAGNIEEWEQTERDMDRTTRFTASSVSNYFTGIKTGAIRSTNSFYADAKNVTKTDVKAAMTNISSEVRIWPVVAADQKNGPLDRNGYRVAEIGTFVEKKTRETYVRGTAFYELAKTEKAVQASKLIVIRSRKDGAVYAGQSARDLLNLPTQGTIKLSPGDFGDWEIFIQSTSSNRHLPVGSKVLYWRLAAR